MGWTQHYKKVAEEWEDKVKQSEEHLKKLKSEKKKKREQYEGELGVVLWNSVNTMQADLDTHTRLGQCLSPCPHTVCVLCETIVGTLCSLLNFASTICEGRAGQSSLLILLLLL